MVKVRVRVQQPHWSQGLPFDQGFQRLFFPGVIATRIQDDAFTVRRGNNIGVFLKGVDGKTMDA